MPFFIFYHKDTASACSLRRPCQGDIHFQLILRNESLVLENCDDFSFVGISAWSATFSALSAAFYTSTTAFEK